MNDKSVAISYYTCSCDWISKYCDDYHRDTVLIPLDALEKYRMEQA